MKFVYGYAPGADNEVHAADHDTSEKFLCGRRVHHIPVVPMPHAMRVHDVCRKAVEEHAEWGRPAGVGDAECPECGGTVRVNGGVVEAHGQYVVRGGRTVESDDWCSGSGVNVDGAA